MKETQNPQHAQRVTVEEKAGQIAEGRILALEETRHPYEKHVIKLMRSAQQLVRTGGVLPFSSGGYNVRGSSGAAYEVVNGRCDCDFYTKRLSAARCKHILAAEFYAAGAAAIVEEYRAEAARLIAEAGEIAG